MTSHDLGPQKVVLGKGIPLLSGKSRLVKYHNLINFASNILITSWFPAIKSIKSTNQPATTRCLKKEHHQHMTQTWRPKVYQFIATVFFSGWNWWLEEDGARGLLVYFNFRSLESKVPPQSCLKNQNEDTKSWLGGPWVGNEGSWIYT